MAEDAEARAKNTPLYYTMFQNMFEMVDVTSYFWQPALKVVGRSHLELASLHARQTRALVHWTHKVMRPATPLDFLNANAELCTALMQEYIDAAPRVAAVVETAAEAVAPAAVPMPAQSARDTLILLDRENIAVSEQPVRKVA